MDDHRLEELELFKTALEIQYPWYIREYAFSREEGRLDIWIGLMDTPPMTCSYCQTDNQPYYDIDRQDQVWRHLDFFEFKTYLHAPHPRVQCAHCQKVKYAKIPWTRYTSRFTLAFEHWVMQLVKEMPVLPAARLIREHDTRIWRIVHHYVDAALQQQDLSSVRRIAVDETSATRGHHYVTVIMNSETRQVIFATEGKDHTTIERFADHLSSHHGSSEQIEEYSSDMSAPFQQGMKNAFPDAHQTIDKFHIMKLIGEAVDETRRKEQPTAPELKKSRYLWLKNERNLTKKQQEQLAALSKSHLKTAKAYQLRMAFQDFWTCSQRVASVYLKIWCNWAVRSQLPDMIRTAQTIRQHTAGILRWFESKMTNGMIEAMNGLIQAAKRKARGYRTTKNLIAIIYLIGGKLA